MAVATDIGLLITSTPGICGGRPRIAGTGISVRRVVILYQQGLTPDEIGDDFPQLTMAQVYGALAHYHTHREEIDADIAAEDAEVARLEQDRLATRGAS